MKSKVKIRAVLVIHTYQPNITRIRTHSWNHISKVHFRTAQENAEKVQSINVDGRQLLLRQAITKIMSYWRTSPQRRAYPPLHCLRETNSKGDSGGRIVRTNSKESICSGLRPRRPYSSQESQKALVHWFRGEGSRLENHLDSFPRTKVLIAEELGWERLSFHFSGPFAFLGWIKRLWWKHGKWGIKVAEYLARRRSQVSRLVNTVKRIGSDFRCGGDVLRKISIEVVKCYASSAVPQGHRPEYVIYQKLGWTMP